MSSCQPETVAFVGGSQHTKTAVVGCGCYVLVFGSEIYRREPHSKVFRLSYEVAREPVQAVQPVNVSSEA